MNEEDVRMKLINPALESAGWKGGDHHSRRIPVRDGRAEGRDKEAAP